MSSIPIISNNDVDALELDHFRKMDYFAVEEYGLPIELMMENAGLQLASLVSKFTILSGTIQIGVGNGNNGGGGLVAARRLAAWGSKVLLDIPVEISKALPLLQLERALTFGAKKGRIKKPNIWVDAYLGFSQRLPLSTAYTERIEQANKNNCLKISLDIPTGFLGKKKESYFKAEHVLSLAAAKNILNNLPDSTTVYLADLGIPQAVYAKFKVRFPPFNKSAILKIEK